MKSISSKTHLPELDDDTYKILLPYFKSYEEIVLKMFLREGETEEDIKEAKDKIKLARIKDDEDAFDLKKELAELYDETDKNDVAGLQKEEFIKFT